MVENNKNVRNEHRFQAKIQGNIGRINTGPPNLELFKDATEILMKQSISIHQIHAAANETLIGKIFEKIIFI